LVDETATTKDPALEEAPQVSEAVLYDEQVRTAFSNPRPIIAGNLVNASIVFAVVYGHASNTVLVPWAIALFVVVLFRLALFSQFKTKNPDIDSIPSWGIFYGVGATLTGCIWGFAGWFFIIPGIPHTQLVTTTIIAGMVAGALSTLRTLPHVFTAFALTATLPVIARFIMFGQFEYVLLSSAIFLFLVLMSVEAFNITRQFKLSATRRIANQELVESLRAAKQSAEAANNTKSEFLASMSHEIRTPMAGVMGFTDMLLNDNLTDESRDKVFQIRTSTDNLLTLLNDILDLSKLEAGKMEVEDVDFHLPSLVDETASLFEHKIHDKNLQLDTNLAEDLPDHIISDPTRIRQILLNLVGNAVKFTEHGHVNIHVSISQHDKGNGNLRFEVKDTGIGISRDTIDRLFTDFTQADASISRKYQGTGLGLSICKRIIDLMSGEIGVESQVGSGSTFWFEIPCKPGQGTDREKDFPVQTFDTVPQHSLKILVAEDNLMNQKIIKAIMEAYGHHVFITEDGAKAVEAHQAHEFDLILMDVRMPEMSGPDATRMIRQMGEEKSGIPIIALTADGMAEHKTEFLASGMDEIVTKPIDQAELLAAINRVMGEEVHMSAPSV